MKLRKLQSLIFLTVCLLGANILKAQTTNYYLKIEGPVIEGSAVATGYEDQIVVVSYGLSVSNNAVVVASSGVVTERSQTGGLELLIQGDVKPIPDLFLGVNAGQVYGKMTLTAVSEGSGIAPIIITLENCAIAAIEQEGVSGDLPVFSVLIAAERIGIKTTTIANDGSAGDVSETKWDFKSNVPF